MAMLKIKYKNTIKIISLNYVAIDVRVYQIDI